MTPAAPLFRQPINLGHTLIKLRIQNRYSQQVVAQLVGVSQSTYSRLESDLQKPTLDQLQQLAELYELPIERLITGNLESRSADSGLLSVDLHNLNDMVNFYRDALAASRKLNEALEAENRQLRLDRQSAPASAPAFFALS